MFFGICYEIPKKNIGFLMFWDQIPKKPWVFGILQNSKKTSSFPKFQNSKKNINLPKYFWNFGILENSRFFLEFWFYKVEKTLQLSKKNKAMRISQNMFWILKNSVVCNVSASFVLNCLHLSIIGFHLLIRSVHFLTRSSYWRTTFSLFSIHLSTYFCTHVVVLID